MWYEIRELRLKRFIGELSNNVWNVHNNYYNKQNEIKSSNEHEFLAAIYYCYLD